MAADVNRLIILRVVFGWSGLTSAATQNKGGRELFEQPRNKATKPDQLYSFVTLLFNHSTIRNSHGTFPVFILEWTFGNNWRLAVAERRKKVAHGETVGERTRLNQAPVGAKGIYTGWCSAAPAGALVAG